MVELRAPVLCGRSCRPGHGQTPGAAAWFSTSTCSPRARARAERLPAPQQAHSDRRDAVRSGEPRGLRAPSPFCPRGQTAGSALSLAVRLTISTQNCPPPSYGDLRRLNFAHVGKRWDPGLWCPTVRPLDYLERELACTQRGHHEAPTLVRCTV